MLIKLKYLNLQTIFLLNSRCLTGMYAVSHLVACNTEQDLSIVPDLVIPCIKVVCGTMIDAESSDSDDWMKELTLSEDDVKQLIYNLSEKRMQVLKKRLRSTMVTITYIIMINLK